MRSDRVVVPPPAFDHDLGFSERVEDFAVEQFVAQDTSRTLIWRIAPTTLWPCENRTSTCRSFVTISSGLCLFLGIAVHLHVQRHTSGRTTFAGVDQDDEAHSTIWFVLAVAACAAVLPTRRRFRR
jgi:hypothetical protein